MKNLKIKTWLPVFPGYYGTYFEANEDQVIEAPYTSDDYNFDYEYYFNDTAKECVKAIQAQLKSLGFNCKIEFEELISPREYNFSNDSINVIFKISPAFVNKLKKYCESNSLAFAAYLERYKSCSGFISSYPHNTETWLTYVNADSLEDRAHYLGALLDFVLNNEGYNDYQLWDDVSDRVYLFGELKESSKPTEFELNGLLFKGCLDDVKSDYEWLYWREWDREISFFDYCLNNIKQIIFNDPNQLSLNL